MENLVTEVKTEYGIGSLFQRRIEFHPARKSISGFSNGGDGSDFKLEILNPSTSNSLKPGSGQGPGQTVKKADGSEYWENGLDPELCFGMTFRRIGAGLQNLGNTCFLNSVLQCLTYTEPLAAYLQSGKHQNSCHIAGFCALCAIQKHVSRALQAPGRILAPKDLVLNLRCISRNFRISRQEDAHEYMVNLLESMHKCCLPSGVPSESPSAYDKSLVHKIFGGRLRSQVKCTQCSYCSNKFDPFLDLSLEIAKAESVYKALKNFTAAELLDGGEKQYQCQKCKQKVRALKQLTVHKAPYVLTVHLKRFRSHNPGQKIDKKVQFGPTIDMKPFVSGSYEGDLKYTLYGVLVHHGWSTHSGHYYCFVRTSSGMWYSLDDNRVVQVSERSVLEQKAYMLFYVRDRKNIALRKPIDVVQKENSKPNVTGNITRPLLNQQSNEHPKSCPLENRICGADSSASLSQKDALNSGSLKETHVKEASSQPKDGQLLSKCPVPKIDPVLEPSSNAPLPNGPSEGPSVINSVPGESLKPSTPSLNSNDDNPKIESTTNLTIASISNSNENGSSKNDSAVPLTSSTNDNGLQNTATIKHATDEKINLVSKAAGVSSIAPTQDSSDKTLERVSDIYPAEDSNDKMVESMCPIKSQDKPSFETMQVEEKSNGSLNGNSLNEKAIDNGQRKTLELVESSTSSVMTNGSSDVKAPDCAPQRKLKKKLLTKNMHFGLKIFRASLGLYKKKKHKRSKRRTLGPQNQLLLDKDCLSLDLEPAKSEKSNTISQKKVANGTAQKKVKICNGGSLTNSVNGELRKRVHQNGAVLATNEQLQKHSDNSEANNWEALEHGSSKDRMRDVMQQEMIKLTRGLEESTVPRWDGIEVHSQSVLSNGTGSLSIGYVPDEWDEEYDRGKRKKLRLNKHSFGGPNPFQEVAVKKTQIKKAKLEHTSSGNRPFRI